MINVNKAKKISVNKILLTVSITWISLFCFIVLNFS